MGGFPKEVTFELRRNVYNSLLDFTLAFQVGIFRVKKMPQGKKD